MDAASQALFFKTSYNIWSILLFLGFCLARLDITMDISVAKLSKYYETVSHSATFFFNPGACR
jgi:hypothetical protein